MQVVSCSFLDSVVVLMPPKGSMLAGSPGSECSASFNGFPSLGIRSWNNGIANMEQGAYGMRLHAEHNFVDMGITADPQNLQDVVPHWPNSTAVCHQPAGEWNPSPQVKPSGERPLPLHRGAGKKQIPDSVIQPYIFDVPLQRNSGTPSNVSNAPLFRTVTHGNGRLLPRIFSVLQSHSSQNQPAISIPSNAIVIMFPCPPLNLRSLWVRT